MKALTVRQPWASLIACGAKKNETRSWYTKYRGPIAIHAGVHPLRDTLAELANNVIGCMKLMLKSKCADAASRPDIHRLPLGCIVATANLVDCVRIDKAFMDEYGVNGLCELTEEQIRNFYLKVFPQERRPNEEKPQRL